MNEADPESNPVRMTPSQLNGIGTRQYDAVISTIVDYAYDYEPTTRLAWTRAKACLLDALGAALESIHESTEVQRLLGPYLPGTSATSGGFKLPGTAYQLDAVKGAFDLGSMIRYLDHNDAFPGAEWGHPSDNIGAILSVADVLARASRANGTSSSAPLTMRAVLVGLIKAYEIQGCFQIKNAFNKVGLDHVILVKVACTAVTSQLLALTKEEAHSAVSHAWTDGHPLRTYRQSPNAGPRKGWAAGEACKQAVHLALAAKAGQPGVKTALTAPRWGFYDVYMGGQPFDLPRPFGSWVVETVLFKINTAEGHAMTAVEAALQVAQTLQARGVTAVEQDVARVEVRTQGPAMTITDKSGPLTNAADRDHCMRYMVAVVMLKGAQIATEDYQNTSPWATDSRVELLRSKIDMVEDAQMTADYYDTSVRSVANGLTVTLADGTRLPEALVEFPQGHVKREDTLELLKVKAERNLALKLPQKRVAEVISRVWADDFEAMPVDEFVDLLWLGAP